MCWRFSTQRSSLNNIGDISNTKFGNGCLFCFVMVQRILYHLEPKGGKFDSKLCRSFCTFPRISLNGSSVLLVLRQNGHVFKWITPYVHSQIRDRKVENQPQLLKTKQNKNQSKQFCTAFRSWSKHITLIWLNRECKHLHSEMAGNAFLYIAAVFLSLVPWHKNPH